MLLAVIFCRSREAAESSLGIQPIHQVSDQWFILVPRFSLNLLSGKIRMHDAWFPMYVCRDEIQRIKANNPDITHREAFSAAAKNVINFIFSISQHTFWSDRVQSLICSILCVFITDRLHASVGSFSTHPFRYLPPPCSLPKRLYCRLIREDCRVLFAKVRAMTGSTTWLALVELW